MGALLIAEVKQGGPMNLSDRTVDPPQIERWLSFHKTVG
jgi:hypothetical protein